jgi:signal peptidase I
MARRHALRRALTGFLVWSALLTGLGASALAPLLDVAFAPVLTPSMRPTFAEGDLLLVRAVDTATLQVGQVVVLADPAPTGHRTGGSTAHRVVALERRDTGVVVRTQGDANETPDPASVSIAAPRTTVVIGHVPLLGHLAVALDDTRWRIGVGLLVVGALTSVVVRAAGATSGTRRARTDRPVADR